MNTAISEAAMQTIFTEARSHAAWTDRPVSDDQLRELHDLAKWGPTSMNCLPMRLVYVRSDDAKALLTQALAEGNVAKVAAAPVTAIVAYDTRFFEQMPRLFPHADGMDEMFAGDSVLSEATAFRNATLQGAYLIIAARSLGLDTGPMSGFDNARLDALFFPDGLCKSNFLLNIGYADHSKIYPRGPRYDFDEIAQIR